MAVTVLISATLRSFASHNAILELEGSSVEEALNILIDEYTDIRKALFDREHPVLNAFRIKNHAEVSKEEIKYEEC